MQASVEGFPGGEANIRGCCFRSMSVKPLDLSKGPPRAPRAELAGIIFLPRSIDKICATLPGGDPGAYTIPGFTQLLIEKLGMSVEAFTDVVAAAPEDAAIAAYVLLVLL